jgi:hypothetical protein
MLSTDGNGAEDPQQKSRPPRHARDGSVEESCGSPPAAESLNPSVVGEKKAELDGRPGTKEPGGQPALRLIRRESGNPYSC